MGKSIKHYCENLYEVAAVVNSVRSPEAVLGSILKNVAEAVGSEGCSLMLLNSKRDLLIHPAVYGLSEKYMNKGPVSVYRSMFETLVGMACPQVRPLPKSVLPAG